MGVPLEISTGPFWENGREPVSRGTSGGAAPTPLHPTATASVESSPSARICLILRVFIRPLWVGNTVLYLHVARTVPTKQLCFHWLGGGRGAGGGVVFTGR